MKIVGCGKDSGMPVEACSLEHKGWSRATSRLLKAGLWGLIQSTEGVTSFLVLQGHGGREREIRICLASTSTAVSHVGKETSVPPSSPSPHSQLEWEGGRGRLIPVAWRRGPDDRNLLRSPPEQLAPGPGRSPTLRP